MLNEIRDDTPVWLDTVSDILQERCERLAIPLNCRTSLAAAYDYAYLVRTRLAESVNCGAINRNVSCIATCDAACAIINRGACNCSLLCLVTAM